MFIFPIMNSLARQIIIGGYEDKSIVKLRVKITSIYPYT